MFRHPKTRYFWPVLLLLLLSDCATKDLAEQHLTPENEPREVFGNVLRFTLTYNTGGAMGVSVGQHSRAVFGSLALLGVTILTLLYRKLPPSAGARAIGLGLLIGGALGNLIDRVRSPRGVVDFIDIGVGTTRFWAFNVGDIGISLGAIVLLAYVMLEDRPAPSRRAMPPSDPHLQPFEREPNSR